MFCQLKGKNHFSLIPMTRFWNGVVLPRFVVPFSHVYFYSHYRRKTQARAQEDRKGEIFAQLRTDFKIALDKYVKRGNRVFRCRWRTGPRWSEAIEYIFTADKEPRRDTRHSHEMPYLCAFILSFSFRDWKRLGLRLYISQPTEHVKAPECARVAVAWKSNWLG